MSQTADRYAKALFELSKEQDNLAPLQGAMTDIRKLIVDLEGFRYFLNNPLLAFEERCVVLRSLFEGKIPDLFLKFLLFITYKNRLNILKDIIESFDKLYLISTNQYRAYVTTALPIDETDKALFNERLRDKFQHGMLTKWKTDASLIGGFRIFLKDKMYDYSFKSQLNHFFQQSTQPA